MHTNDPIRSDTSRIISVDAGQAGTMTIRVWWMGSGTQTTVAYPQDWNNNNADNRGWFHNNHANDWINLMSRT